MITSVSRNLLPDYQIPREDVKRQGALRLLVAPSPRLKNSRGDDLHCQVATPKAHPAAGIDAHRGRGGASTSRRVATPSRIARLPESNPAPGGSRSGGRVGTVRSTFSLGPGSDHSRDRSGSWLSESTRTEEDREPDEGEEPSLLPAGRHFGQGQPLHAHAFSHGGSLPCGASLG